MSAQSESDQQPTIEVCFGPQCSDAGGRALADELNTLGLKCSVGDCRNQCPHAPVVLVDDRMVTKATAGKVMDRVKAL